MVGIIWIQTSWIGDAIAGQEQDFEVRVNEALNTVNDSIDTEEVELFLKQKFGGVDSLVNEFIVFPEDQKESVVEINVSQGKSRGNVERDEVVIIRSSKESRRDRTATIRDSSSVTAIVVGDDSIPNSKSQMVWSERIERRVDGPDSTTEHEVFYEQRKRVQSVVQRYTLETLFSGELRDRLDPKDLKEKIGKALKREGISGKFAFAVKNDRTGKFESDFTSKHFPGIFLTRV